MITNRSIIFNSKFDRLGKEKITGKQFLSPSDNIALAQSQKEVISEFCEELLLFDKVSLKADRYNYALFFLIKEFGINTIQEYFERGLIEILLWTPLIVTSTGSIRENGTIDRESVLGKSPIVSGHLSEEDSNPENNIKNILKNFYLNKDRSNSFINAAIKSIIIPNNALAVQAVDLTIDAYKTGKLNNIGIKNEKVPENLNVDERLKLLELSHDVLETSILAQYGYKSFNDYSYTEISDKAFDSIASALKVKENSKTILTLENMPDLKSLFFSGQLNKVDLKTLRYKSTAKQFRKWLNEVSSNQDCTSISKEYMNEITGKNDFWDTTKGKIVKNVGMLGVGSALGAAIGSITITSVAIGSLLAKGAELGLGLFDSFFLDGLLKGKNPRLFIDEIEKKKRVQE